MNDNGNEDDNQEENGKGARENGRKQTWGADPLIADLTAQANSKDAQQRRSALRALQGAGAGGMDALLGLLWKNMAARRNTRIAISTFAWIFVGLSVFMVPALLFSICLSATGWFATLAFIIWAITWALFALRTRLPLTARQKEVAGTLEGIEDIRAIAPLLDALGPRPDHDPPQIRAVLARLLNRVRASDANLLDRGQRGVLYRELGRETLTGEQIEFTVAILRALEQIGTGEALPYVAQLARRTYPRPAPLNVLSAAQRCLEFLQQRGGSQTIRQTYLRASDKNTTQPDTLLRPADDTGATPAEQLLRPDHTPAEGEDR